MAAVDRDAAAAARAGFDSLTWGEGLGVVNTHGFMAYRAALAATGTEPPNVTGPVRVGTYMGTDEATAYQATAQALEQAIDADQLNPGRSGWRKTAEQITRTT